MTGDLRYPVGRFSYDRPYSEAERADLITGNRAGARGVATGV